MIRLRHHCGCRSRFSATNALFRIPRKRGDPFRRSSDSWLLSAGALAAASAFPENPVTDFRQKKLPYHIQRRYRPGFKPGYLVQQRRFSAEAATEFLSNCPQHHSTGFFPCQHLYMWQHKNLHKMHINRLRHGFPRISKPRKEPACWRYVSPPFSKYFKV